MWTAVAETLHRAAQKTNPVPLTIKRSNKMTREEFLDAVFPHNLSVTSSATRDEGRAKGWGTLAKAMLS